MSSDIMTSPLTSLRERLEAASGPDRELDAEIDAALFGGRAAHTFGRETPNERVRSSYGVGSVFDHSDPDTNRGYVLLSMVRHAGFYTSSIDAAVSLAEGVLPGWRLALEIEDGLTRECYLTGPEYKSDCSRPDQMAQGRCGVRPAIGICAALVRALEAKEPAMSGDSMIVPSSYGELIERLNRFRSSANLLLQNSEGCAVNHYGADFEQQGMPGWLVDARKDIEAGVVAIATLAAERDEARRWVKYRDRKIELMRKYWLRDAKEALAGDMRALRNRVDLAESEPVEIVLSDDALSRHRKEGA